MKITVCFNYLGIRRGLGFWLCLVLIWDITGFTDVHTVCIRLVLIWNTTGLTLSSRINGLVVSVVLSLMCIVCCLYEDAACP